MSISCIILISKKIAKNINVVITISFGAVKFLAKLCLCSGCWSIIYPFLLALLVAVEVLFFRHVPAEKLLRLTKIIFLLPEKGEKNGG